MSSLISESSSSRESTDTKDDVIRSDTRSRKEERESSLCPFKLAWSIGINPETPLINLTTKNRTIIAYASSHAVIIYNYKTKEALTLQGHQNPVAALSASRDGKWLLSADFEEDCAVVIWDTESGVPVSTLFNPHDGRAISAAEISPNAKYIVTVGNESPQMVRLWLWTYGNNESDASVVLSDMNSDRVKKIAFNEHFCEEFVLTGDHSVVFCKWGRDQVRSYLPKILGNVRRYGIFNCSCYVSGTQRALTATTTGYVLIWDRVVVVATEKGSGKSKSEATVYKDEKKHIKSVRLQKRNITAMIYHDGIIAMGAASGRISFYDINLKILYWWQNDRVDSIRSISFDLTSALISPAALVNESELEFEEGDDDDEDYEYEEEEGEYSRTKFENNICDEKLEHIRKIKSVKSCEEVSSTTTVYVEERFRDHRRGQKSYLKSPHVPTDATLESQPFYTDNFCLGCSNGTVALVEIPALKCQFILQNATVPVTSLDAHPRSDYMVIGNAQGFVSMYDYVKHKLVVRKKIPVTSDFHRLLDEQVKTGNIIYVTCPQTREKLAAVTLLKYSPIADFLACGLEDGSLWMLHPITLELLDKNPYKHSNEAIIRLAFTECAEYMAYADYSFVVAAFKRNRGPSSGPHAWNFLGSYRSHCAPIRDVLFGPATTTSVVPRLFSLAEDRNLIEYDLKNSGPFPSPGLQILDIQKIECTAIPLCLAWYPQFNIEGFMMYSNSEYKYRLLNDMTKTIRGTFLGPLYGEPVKRFKVLSRKEFKGNTHMVFATKREIGLQILPFDGNPYKILGMIGHPRKITNISVNCDETVLFTSGYNDPCVLMWKIKTKAVDVLAQLGGPGLSPYYCLIEDGAKGWLINEMKDLFYYAQILRQGENTTAPRIISDTVDTKEIPNLVRAVGFYPSNEEIEILMGEISYRNYAETGRLVKEITFEDFVKLYINHRPANGISLNHVMEAFQIFTNPTRVPALEMREPELSREQFMKILLGEGPGGFSKEDGMPFGEPLTMQEASMYLQFLVDLNEEKGQSQRERETSASADFSFLPEKISYKKFIADIMGIELPEETRVDDD